MPNQRDQHIVQQQIQQEIQQMVAYQGFAIRQVFSTTRNSPSWAYTVGLYRPERPHPELFISGLTPELRASWLLDLGFRINGPPSLQMQRKQARAYGLSVADLVYPAGGEVFHPGRRYRPAQGDLPACFGLVEQRSYEDYFGQAIAYHGTVAFPVLQFTWSDAQGLLPFEVGYDPQLIGRQELLYDPLAHLPLVEEHVLGEGGGEP